METNFGDNIRLLRRARGLTQEDLADFLGVSFQSVSKWERNENFPDILMLPRIASFFDVTTDYLLGADNAGQEAKVQAYIDEYFHLWETGDLTLLCRRLKLAIYEHPGDYRLIVRYFNTLTAEAIRANEPLRVRNEAEALYASIGKHCTVDSIRIWSQKIMANYYKELSKLAGSGIGAEDVESILDNMPLMQNARDFAATYLYDGEARKTACANAICELSYLLGQALINLCETDISIESKINALESMLAMLEIFFPRVDYGKLLTSVIHINTLLVRYNHELGQDDRAIEALHRAAKTAKKFDALDESEPVAYTSPLLQGISVTKQKIPHHDGRAKTDVLAAFLHAIGKPEWAELI